MEVNVLEVTVFDLLINRDNLGLLGMNWKVPGCKWYCKSWLFHLQLERVGMTLCQNV